MSDHEPMEARWVEFPPQGPDEGSLYNVGGKISFDHVRLDITRITVQQDLPGMYCNLRRVCVWSGDLLVFEAPLHNVQGVGYLPARKPA